MTDSSKILWSEIFLDNFLWPFLKFNDITMLETLLLYKPFEKGQYCIPKGASKCKQNTLELENICTWNPIRCFCLHNRSKLIANLINKVWEHSFRTLRIRKCFRQTNVSFQFKIRKKVDSAILFFLAVNIKV
jgi:hypothetical protein